MLIMRVHFRRTKLTKIKKPSSTKTAEHGMTSLTPPKGTQTGTATWELNLAIPSSVEDIHYRLPVIPHLNRITENSGVVVISILPPTY